MFQFSHVLEAVMITVQSGNVALLSQRLPDTKYLPTKQL